MLGNLGMYPMNDIECEFLKHIMYCIIIAITRTSNYECVKSSDLVGDVRGRTVEMSRTLDLVLKLRARTVRYGI